MLHFRVLSFTMSAFVLIPSRPEYGQTNTTAFLESAIGNHSTLIALVEQEYAIGSTANGWPITDAFDQISAIYTDAMYQCPLSIVVNDSMNVGIPTWRYMYNATFPDIMPLPGVGVFHGSEGAYFFLVFPGLYSHPSRAFL
jgi:hypothetical protein